MTTIASTNPPRTWWLGAAVVVVVLCLPGILLWTLADPQFGDFHSPAVLSICTVVLLVLAASRRPAVVLFLVAPLTALAPLEAYYIANYRQASGYEILASALDTNLPEIVEIVGIQHFVLGLSLCVLAGVLPLLLAWQGRRVTFPRWTWPATVIGVATLAYHGVHCWQRMDYQLNDQALNWAFHTTAMPASLEPYARSFPAGLLLRLAVTNAERSRLDRLRNELDDFRFNAVQSPRAARDPQVHVLVIGETARAANWQLNGYAKATNPRLSIREQVINFPDMLSHWNLTRRSVPQLLTRRDPRYARDAFPEKSVVSAFSEAGFHTVWLSNQRRVGEHDSLIGMYAGEAHQTRFIGLGHWRQASTPDGELLSPFRQILATHREDLFIVVHLMGSHYNYSLRVPFDFAGLPPPASILSDTDNLDPKRHADVVAAYDRSLEYTDWVLDQLIEATERDGRSATLLYISDHGEDLAGPDCHLGNHGNPTWYNFHVPSVLWYSTAYSLRYPEKIASLRSHANWRIASSIIFSTLLGMADVSVSGTSAQLDLSSNEFRPPQRWVNLPVPTDADHATVEEGCRVIRASRE